MPILDVELVAARVPAGMAQALADAAGTALAPTGTVTMPGGDTMHQVRLWSRAALLASMLLASWGAAGQERQDPVALMAAQRSAIATFGFMDGTWRGPATSIRENGDKHAITQTERIGPLLDGTVKVIEGRGYEADGTTSFNAFAILSYDVATKSFRMRSYAMGRSGDYPVQRTADGFSWEIPAGPMTIRYNAIVKDGVWVETGDRVMPGREPFRFFEMRLVRLGDSAWPGAGAVSPK
jgi:hypothetical protein